MNDSIFDKLFIKYLPSDHIGRRKALVLLISSIVIMSTIIVGSFLRNTNNTVSTGENLYSIFLVLGILVIFSIVRKNLLKHAVFSLLIWIVFYYVYLLLHFGILLLIVIPLLFTIVKVTQSTIVQSFILSIISIVFLMIQLVQVILDFTKGVSSFDTYFITIISAIFLVFFCVLVFFYFEVIQKEIEKADKTISDSTIDFLLKTNRRRSKDHDDTLEDQVSILLIGINDINLINEKLGNQNCDSLLKEMITLIRNTVRIDDYILRWNYDEFLVMLQNITLSNSTIVAEKIRKSIEFYGFTDRKQRVTVTICATAKYEDQLIQEAITRAEHGLSKAKTQRKNYVIIP